MCKTLGYRNSLSISLRRGKVDQKRIDAQEMIAAMREHLAAGVSPLTTSYRFQETGYHKAATGQFTEDPTR